MVSDGCGKASCLAGAPRREEPRGTAPGNSDDGSGLEWTLFLHHKGIITDQNQPKLIASVDIVSMGKDDSCSFPNCLLTLIANMWWRMIVLKEVIMS